ncbi:putative nucleotidyltransferase [Salirhabdus euzebyi]|uniref:Putative nucleotidyltransferase n=1 Tax=Salirhabdus euzebyi TaxID=394506 RepID=A0A841Q1V4_9BACI|nr:nucleotidyltransferase domain-containing protein [Salirhabdus euzebyi]MBB6452413.1 putative nucleotidyltransferase [Salirhabdus euzebyi]
MKENFKDILHRHSIYQVITGSTAYGLANDHSDVDQKAIVILPPTYLLQLSKEWETESYHNPDIEYHSLKKAMNLLNAQNPTMLETLFVKEEFVKKQTKYGELLRNNRHLFLSQNCYYSFYGYAKDQLMRIKNGLNKVTEKDQNEHVRYTLQRMLSQMDEKYPSLKNGTVIIKDVFSQQSQKQEADLSVSFDAIPLTELHGCISELAGTLKSYNKTSQQNKKPTDKLHKHAMHLVRLLLMGIELLEKGTLTVDRGVDRDYLLSIRNGDVRWDDFFELTEELFQQLENAKEKTLLPNATDDRKINDLYFEIMSNFYNI